MQFTKTVTHASFRRFGLLLTPICVRKPHGEEVPHYGVRFDLSFARHRVMLQWLYKAVPETIEY